MKIIILSNQNNLKNPYFYLMNFSYLKIFKRIGFMLNHYISVVNLDVVSSLNVFSKFNFIC